MSSESRCSSLPVPAAARSGGHTPRRLGGFLLLWQVFLTLPAAAQVRELPEQLVLQFDGSAAALDQGQIREALRRELGVPLAESGSANAATLRVSVDGGGDLELTYDPERRRITRSVPLTPSSDVPELVAQLAGNLVRDEAAQLVSALSPAPPPAETSSSGSDAAPPAPAADDGRQPRPWSLAVLLGGGIQPMAFGVFTLQVSRRFGFVELGLALEAASGRGSAALTNEHHAGFYGGSGTYERESIPVLTLTLPASLDVDLVRRKHGSLQVGGTIGYRLAGAMHEPKHLSGSNGDLFLGVRFTAGLTLREQRAVILRGTWDVWPQNYLISVSDGTIAVLPFGTSLQLGYVMAF
jgi:hypothetical protein